MWTMINKGVTLIELLIAISIFLIIATLCSDIFVNEIKDFKLTSININSSEELKIAMDFVYDKITIGNSITAGVNQITIDKDKVYLKNNVLRYDEDQQQIACNIDSFEVQKYNTKGLYKIILCSGKYTSSRFIYKVN